METYGLTKEIFSHLLRSAKENGYDSLTEYLLKEAPNTYVVVDDCRHYAKQGGEDLLGVAYYTYGSYEAAREDYEDSGIFGCEIITELQFLCCNGFNATKFFVNNIDNEI